MRTQNKLVLDAVVTESLKALAADRIPPAARDALDDDLIEACGALIRRRITADYVGKMVMTGLARTATAAARPATSSAPPAPQPSSADATGAGL